MSSFREAVGVATKSAICTVLAGAEASSYVSRIGIPAPGSQTVIDTIRRARRAVCDNPDPEVDVPEASFSGGQCPGTRYRVETASSSGWGRCPGSLASITNPSTTGDRDDVYGPIENISIEVESEGDCGPTRVQAFIDARDANGQPARFESGGSMATGRSDLFLQGFQIDSISITAVDGPDDCGDPDEPPIPDYSPVTIRRDVTYIDNSETEITEEGDFTINAPVLIGGNIIAPVSIDLGGVEVPVELNLSTGDITFDFEGGDTPAPTDDGDDDIPPPDDEPEIEEGSLIYGLIVYSTPATGEGSVTSEIAQGDAPVLLLPRTGNVWFQVPVGDRISWMGPIPVQSQNQLVPVPGGLAASGYRLFPNTGWQLSVVRMGKPPCGCVSG